MPNTVVKVQAEGHGYSEVERGISIFSASDDVTGSTGAGTSSVSFQFNPSADTTFQPFVAITSILVATRTAAPTGSASVYQSEGQWDRHRPGTGQAQFPIELIQTHSSTDYAGAWFGFKNLGRAEKETVAQLVVRVEEINTQVLTVTVEGLISDHPIAGRWWVSA